MFGSAGCKNTLWNVRPHICIWCSMVVCLIMKLNNTKHLTITRPVCVNIKQRNSMLLLHSISQHNEECWSESIHLSQRKPKTSRDWRRCCCPNNDKYICMRLFGFYLFLKPARSIQPRHIHCINVCDSASTRLDARINAYKHSRGGVTFVAVANKAHTHTNNTHCGQCAFWRRGCPR